MCKCVDIFFGGWWMKLLHMISLSLVIFLVWAIFFFFFLSCLGDMWHIFFGYASFFYMSWGHVAYLLWVCIFYFFLYSPYIMMITLERDKHGTTWSFICGWRVLFVDEWGMYLLSSRCRSIACEWTCTWSWSWAYEVILTKGHNNLTKLNEMTSCICGKAV